MYGTLLAVSCVGMAADPDHEFLIPDNDFFGLGPAEFAGEVVRPHTTSALHHCHITASLADSSLLASRMMHCSPRVSFAARVPYHPLPSLPT